jgi:hypothetical protein
VLYFFLKTAERPEEAPASSLEKRELNENLQRIAGIGTLFYLLLKNGRTNKTFIKFVLLAFYMCKNRVLKYGESKKYYYDSENQSQNKDKKRNKFGFVILFLVASALFGSLIFVILLNTPTFERPLVDS